MIRYNTGKKTSKNKKKMEKAMKVLKVNRGAMFYVYKYCKYV